MKDKKKEIRSLLLLDNPEREILNYIEEINLRYFSMCLTVVSLTILVFSILYISK